MSRPEALARELTADLFVSLDGYAAGEGAGPYFGYAGPELEAWVRTNAERPQVALMGRVTYETLARISAGDDASATLTALPKLVVSGTLEEPLGWANARLLRGDLATGLEALKRQAGPPLRTIGSLTLVASLLELGLVDRMRLLVFPLTLGDRGREPISRLPAGRLDLLDARVLDGRLLLLEHRPRVTRVGRHLAAPRGVVYAALVDPAAIARWKVPAGMTAHVHRFEAREGGAVRVSLTYEEPTEAGKTSARTDTYHGRLVELVPGERVVEIDEFETSDPALGGAMRTTITLTDGDDGGTELRAVHAGLPPGLSLADNEVGWSSALARLAALVEDGA
jgi:uncharacterized protein YndB with AHSA1/START domain/dihydrofolate reductase